MSSKRLIRHFIGNLQVSYAKKELRTEVSKEIFPGVQLLSIELSSNGQSKKYPSRDIYQNVIVAVTFLLLSCQILVADVNVLLVGSTRDMSERIDNSSVSPFSPSATTVAARLKDILDGAGVGTANVVAVDRYTSAASPIQGTKYSYNLASWFHFPYPKDVEQTRWSDLRGEEGTDWDYVVLIGDGYTIENMPGVYSHGVAQVAKEVTAGGGDTILLMSWPMGSSSSVEHYKDVIYRTGRSGGHMVAPAGQTWNEQGKPTGNTAAYLAAASIYSRIYRESASNSSYSYNDSLANAANTNVDNNVGQSQYSGALTHENPFLMGSDNKRMIYHSDQGTSTEEAYKRYVQRAMERCNVDYSHFESGNFDSQGLSVPADFNHGRHGTPTKQYIVDPSKWNMAVGFAYGPGTWGYDAADGNDHQIGYMVGLDFHQANILGGLGSTARYVPVKTLWAQIHREYPDELAVVDSSQHSNFH